MEKTVNFGKKNDIFFFKANIKNRLDEKFLHIEKNSKDSQKKSRKITKNRDYRQLNPPRRQKKSKNQFLKKKYQNFYIFSI